MSTEDRSTGRTRFLLLASATNGRSLSEVNGRLDVSSAIASAHWMLMCGCCDKPSCWWRGKRRSRVTFMIDGILAALVLRRLHATCNGRASDETQRAMVELVAVEVVQCHTVATGDARRFARTPGNAIRFDRKAARATGKASTQCTGTRMERQQRRCPATSLSGERGGLK